MGAGCCRSTVKVAEDVVGAAADAVVAVSDALDGGITNALESSASEYSEGPANEETGEPTSIIILLSSPSRILPKSSPTTPARRLPNSRRRSLLRLGGPTFAAGF